MKFYMLHYKVQISFYRSHLLPSDPVLGYYLWRVAKIQAVEMNQTITARDLLQQVSLWLINRKTKMVDNLHIPVFLKNITAKFLWLSLDGLFPVVLCGYTASWNYISVGHPETPDCPGPDQTGVRKCFWYFQVELGQGMQFWVRSRHFYRDIKYFILRISGINLEFWWKIYFAFRNFILLVISFNDKYYTFLLAYSVILLHHFRLYWSDFCSLKHFMNH